MSPDADGGHVNTFHLSRLHKESPCLPLTRTTSCPSTSPPLSPPPPSFSPAKNERHSIYSLSLSASTPCCLSASTQRPAISHIFCALRFFLSVLISPSRSEAILGLASVFNLSAPVSAVNANSLLVMGYLLHQGQGVH